MQALEPQVGVIWVAEKNRVFSKYRRCPKHHNVGTAGRTIILARFLSPLTLLQQGRIWSRPMPPAQLLYRTSASSCLLLAAAWSDSETPENKHFNCCCEVQGDISIFPHVWVKGKNSTQMFPTLGIFPTTQLSNTDFLPCSTLQHLSRIFEVSAPYSTQKLVHHCEEVWSAL